MKKTVLVPVADGTEELEAVAIIDVLRRADAGVTVAAVGNNLQITASRGVVLVADTTIDVCADKTFDLIALPGGLPGAEHLRDSVVLTDLLKRQFQENRLLGAICASPAVVLEFHGLLKGRTATCHPACTDQMRPETYVEQPVVTDQNCITGKGPGVAVDFALELVARLYGLEKRDAVAGPMCL
ncbi:DJ-1/PfpI family protein [Desulfosarcina sp. OttesenSCG-928-A07]|nr:DJ-1/PfpI family protein [Desulfosarcina sp. OttesenSCG-928-G17]MDL2329691.1 DJ-1/PfpI family protein [Desulfosarcina sp. OttesenSCG-928-A07]